MSGPADGSPTFVLLLEDSEDDAFFLKRAWKARGREEPILWVENGAKAKQLLAKQAAAGRYPRVIITDLKMHQCDGFEFLRWLRTQSTLKETTCMVLSSSSEARDREVAQSLGADGFFTKPSASQAYATVLERIEAYLAEAGGRRRISPTDTPVCRP